VRIAVAAERGGLWIARGVACPDVAYPDDLMTQASRKFWSGRSRT